MDGGAGGATDATAFLERMVKRAAGKGNMPAHEAQAAHARIRIPDALAEMAACDLVVEAIIEDLDIKRALFATLEAVVADDCIVASNTSSLSITAIAGGCARPGRIAGYHFFNPVPLLRVVEVVEGLNTESWVA